jgi:hypothetical protein
VAGGYKLQCKLKTVSELVYITLECGLKFQLHKLILQQQERRSYEFLDPSNTRNGVPTRFPRKHPCLATNSHCSPIIYQVLIRLLLANRLGISMCCIFCSRCAKTHLRATVISKNFPGVIPPDPLFMREGIGKGLREGEEGAGERKGREVKGSWGGKGI